MNEDLKAIDLELGKTVVGGNETMAKELLTLLADNLPEHQRIIKEACQKNDKPSLISESHRLHGATCYTGTPRLKIAAKELEMAAKENQDAQIPKLTLQLDNEIALFFSELKKQ